MPDVYVAPEPHRCNISSFFWLDDNNMVWYPKGSIWQCDECGQYWVMATRWQRVKWWHLRRLRRIRQEAANA